MNQKPVSVGLIGCGAQGHAHLRAIKEIGGEKAELTALCDVDEGRLQKAQQVWPTASTYIDYRTMLEAVDLDLVIVATMPNNHALMSLASLEAGAHILCEKPFMMNAEEAQQVLDTAAKCGKQIQLGANMRYMPVARYMHDLVASGTMGKPVLCKTWGCHLKPPVWAPHYHRSTSGGGVLASTLIHGMDLSMWVGGAANPVSVSASMSRLFPGKRRNVLPESEQARFDVEDLLIAVARFDNGATYIFEGNWCDERKNSHGFELITERGTLSSDPFEIKIDIEGDIVDRTPDLAQEQDWGASILNQDTDLINCLLSGTPWSMHDPRQLLNLQKLVDGCYASAAQGREIVL